MPLSLELIDIPWYAALFLSLLVIVAGVSRKLNTGLVMLSSGLLLLLASEATLEKVIRTAGDTLFGWTTRILLVSILLLGVMGGLLKQTGALQKMIVSLERLLGDLKLLTAVLPAFIGILTVPGGAVFSAPLVEQSGNKAGLGIERQAAINLWFRHSLYFMYPLYPSLILAAELSGVGVLTFFYYNISLTAAALLSAYAILFRGLPGKSVSRKKSGTSILSRDLAGLAVSAAPLLTVLLLVIIFDLLFPIALAAGCLVAIIGGIPIRREFFPVLYMRVKMMLLPSVKLDLALVVLGIMFFKNALENSGVTLKLSETMLELGIPLLILMFVFPAAIGLLTGDNAASVAIVFPLLLPLFNHGSPLFAAFVAFTYFSTAWGHIFTPIHPCFSLNNSYYRVKISTVLRQLFWPAAITVLVAWLQLGLLLHLFQ